VTSSPGRHPVAFAFVLATTALLFVNFTWFREQTCIVLCPYGRLQGALYDQDTIVVGYDARRGEPRRGAPSVADAADAGASGASGAAGDCVDCYRCVAVCPTGIDIRNGTQLECVGCANCIDACDAVMAKLGKPPGLVRHDSQRGFATGTRRFLRGRVVLYAVLLLAGLGAFALASTRRRPFEALLVRAPGRAYALEDGRVHNVFELQLVNKRPGERTFTIEPAAIADVEIVVADRELRLASLEARRVPVHVFVPTAAFRAGLRAQLRVRCADPDGELERIATVPLLGPSAAAGR
jgi:cytochrome c oxidase accessory protein FixG